MAKSKFYGTGRRKKSIARVYLYREPVRLPSTREISTIIFGLETLKTDRSSAARCHRVPKTSSTSFVNVRRRRYIPVRLVLSVMVSPEHCSRQMPITVRAPEEGRFPDS